MSLAKVATNIGRRGYPSIRANCDYCNRSEVIPCSKGAEGRAIKKIQEMGWSVIKKDLRCPKCEAQRKVENMSPKVKPAAPTRLPTRAQRREIYLMLADCYDCDNERYQRGDTDETLAEVLSVMPGWVAEIREKDFGPDGGNEDIEALTKQCQSFLKDAHALVAKRDKETDTMAAAIKQVTSISEQLEKIKKSVGPRNLKRAGV